MWLTGLAASNRTGFRVGSPAGRPILRGSGQEKRAVPKRNHRRGNDVARPDHPSEESLQRSLGAIVYGTLRVSPLRHRRRPGNPGRAIIVAAP